MTKDHTEQRLTELQVAFNPESIQLQRLEGRGKIEDLTAVLQTDDADKAEAVESPTDIPVESDCRNRRKRLHFLAAVTVSRVRLCKTRMVKGVAVGVGKVDDAESAGGNDDGYAEKNSEKQRERLIFRQFPPWRGVGSRDEMPRARKQSGCRFCGKGLEDITGSLELGGRPPVKGWHAEVYRGQVFSAQPKIAGSR